MAISRVEMGRKRVAPDTLTSREGNAMTAVYNRSGIRFLYPENWSVTEDQIESTPRSISVAAPSGAFWSVDVHALSVDVHDLLELMLRTLSEEYDEMEHEPIEMELADQAARGYELIFYCLDFVIQAQVLVLQSGHATYALLSQAEVREYEKLAKVFEAISQSLLDDSLTDRALKRI